jgi:polyamine oxidase
LRVEALPDKQVKEEVMGILKDMFPNVTIPEPLDFYFPRWNADKLFRGSYSNWPPSFFTQHHENLRANVGRLFFSGEAMSSRWFGMCYLCSFISSECRSEGFLHGAYFEGLAAAQTVVNCIGNGTTHESCAGLAHVEDVTNALPYNVNL